MWNKDMLSSLYISLLYWQVFDLDNRMFT